MRHLSSWILLLLSLFTPCTHNEVTVETCIGETASFKWDYKVPPFYAVEWYFGKTQIAEAFDEHLSQDSLSINGSYKSRFVLLEEDKIGFSLTNVNSEDNGDYKCIVNLRSTNVRVEKKGTLNVKDCNTHSTSTSRPGEGTTTPKPTPADDNTLAIVLGVLIPCVVAIGLLGVFGLWRKRKLINRSPEGGVPTEAGIPMTSGNT
ncbi:uncharacterized protein LOC124254804 isoform X3 [Haliotis rubra]|uniref:uncharacterized protein LOC124254804 isoform X3 n=1 Tax=Haliotis rubra TaxID=36100 RepID=UPI001EE614FE|nr:uncharacterized protein LOC124254804 isoform X3 [Haliotis rubra]